MAQPHAKPAPYEVKKHGDPLEAAHESDTRTSDARSTDIKPDAIPAPDNGGHAHSAAAHLGNAKGHTKPAGNLRQGSNPGALREPPMVVTRVGKQHRG